MASSMIQIREKRTGDSTWNLAQRTELKTMQPILVFDFADLPQNSVSRQVKATEQLAVLCGLNRRTCRRIGKTVFQILTNFSLESLLENAIHLQPTPQGWALEFQFTTHRINPSDGSHGESLKDPQGLSSLRRAGEKVEMFRISGSSDDGFDVRFSQSLPAGFEVPTSRERGQWRRIISKGDWEEAFERLSKVYATGRSKIQQLQDGVSIRREVLDDDNRLSDVILSHVASRTDNPVMILSPDGKIEWINHAFQQLTKVDLEKLDAPNATNILFANSDDETITAEFANSLADGESFNIEYIWKDEHSDPNDSDPRGTTWIAFQITPVRDDQDVIVRWIAIGADVTRQRQAELAMQAAKEIAESASTAKSEFLAMMSHEIRTPMNAIMGMTELALGTNLTMEQREYITTANNSAQSLLHILNDVLDLSKVEASRLELEQTDFNLADLTRDTLDTLSVLAQKKNLSLCCDFPLDIPQQLVGDPIRLRQVLVNLVGNAIKFTQQGSVSVAASISDELDDSATIHYSICDTGAGIAENKISRIFEAFYQTDASVTRNFGGTGLGLAITSELLQLMGGRIWVESKLGKGSTFHFVVTLPKSARPAIGIAENVANELFQKSVLVVDSNLTNQQTIQGWLTKFGCKTEFASDDRDAMGRFTSEESADVVLLDFDTDGQERISFAKSILVDENISCKPILLFPSDDRMRTIEKCRELGIEDYLVKPISPRTLLAGINNALGRAVARVTSDDLLEGGQNHLTGVHNSNGIQKTDEPFRVLIVDDHPSNRKLISEILRRRGHQWMEAGSGDEAIRLIDKNVFDVVLMDIQMPGKDGLQTTAEIRDAAGERAFVPIIAVTAYVTEEDRQRCMNARMDDYLAKPVNISELVDKVERWGLTVRDERSIMKTEDLEDQLQIQDVPDWATQIANTVMLASDETNFISNASISSFYDAELLVPGEFKAALARFGGDVRLLKMQMGFFLDETPGLLANIQAAIQGCNAKDVLHYSHRLKGLVRCYDDEQAGELAANLEQFGQTEKLEKADETFDLLAGCVDQLSKKIHGFACS